jgi:hypothetical protein
VTVSPLSPMSPRGETRAKQGETAPRRNPRPIALHPVCTPLRNPCGAQVAQAWPREATTTARNHFSDVFTLFQPDRPLTLSPSWAPETHVRLRLRGHGSAAGSRNGGTSRRGGGQTRGGAGRWSVGASCASTRSTAGAHAAAGRRVVSCLHVVGLLWPWICLPRALGGSACSQGCAQVRSA